MNQDIKDKLQKADEAYREWKKKDFEDRQHLIAGLGRILRARTDEFAEIITREMHKPIAQAAAEIEKCGRLCDYYSQVPNVLAKETVETQAEISEVHYSPLGAILGVMPWNFPFWQALRFAVPTILAGNVVVLKHASICQKSGDALEELFLQAGFEEGIFQHLKVSHEEVAEILADPIVQGVSLTGSVSAGRKIAAEAGKNLKKSVLELGGSDAFIVLDDADLDETAKRAAKARLQNCGQTCIAAKRFIIQSSVYDDFMTRFKKEYEKYQPADPMDPNTIFSSMARPDLADDLKDQYEEALENGARAIVPLEKVDEISFSPGLMEMNKENPILRQELFGPLGMVLTAETDEELLTLANDTEFGLGNTVWTSDPERAYYFAENLESGYVSINEILSSTPELPFGGTKNSGYGSELSTYALKEFVTLKTITGHY